ncbi:MAG TPA: hypothetical protein VL400_26860 [Polyangiaceae bacterium]|nr:hypothetical protein [Polyangiaceae bacterium]
MNAARASFALAASCFALVAACNVTVEKDTAMPEPTAAVTADPIATAEPTATETSAPTAAPTGAQKMCTQMACVDGLNIDFEPNGPMKKGKYTFTIEADGKKQECTGSLPLPACEKGRALTCKGEGDAMIMESGCALPPDQQGFGPIMLKTGPAAVKITVKKDGATIGTADLKPSYRTVQPNGPDCGPTCKQASEKIAIKH